MVKVMKEYGLGVVLLLMSLLMFFSHLGQSGSETNFYWMITWGVVSVIFITLLAIKAMRTGKNNHK